MPTARSRRLRTALVLACLLATGASGAAASARAATASTLPPPPFGNSVVKTGPRADQHVHWWRQARVGMFVHFGLYSILGRGEWAQFTESMPRTEYARLADRFAPDPSAPAEWTRVAKDAGFRYIVMTSRHHDGFALFASKANAFNASDTHAHQDVVAEFLEAARGQGLRTGLYYSPLDWRFPGYFMPDLYLDSAEALRDEYHREIKQLSTQYGPIDLLWYDGGGEQWLGFGGIQFNGNWQSRPRTEPYRGRFSWQDDLVDRQLHEAQPGILINDRTSAPGDWRTRENVGNLGEFDNIQPWELCITLAGAWGYQPGAKPRSLAELVSIMTRTVTRDGNLLINVGPAPDGHIPSDQIARLHELGQWLQANGSAIYGTRGGPFLPTETIGSTRTGQTVFLHVLPDAEGHFPRTVRIPAITSGAAPVSAKLIGSSDRLRTVGSAEGTSITLPRTAAGTPSIIVGLRYRQSVMNDPVVKLPPQG
jgi:alpha-L-fucosidase